jgi:histidinol-phosphate aminotransferase
VKPPASSAQRFVRADVQAMASYHVPDATGLIKLDAMENPYGLPEEVRQELSQTLGAVALNRYPQPAYTPLKEALKAAFDIPAASQVIVGNGSDELISMLIIATAPGVVISAWPSFVMYDLSARFAGSRFVGVPLKAQDFSLDVEAMLAAIAELQPAVVFLAYPNNPTGNCFDEAAMLSILQAAPGLVVIDEAYQPFAQSTWMSRLAEFPNLVVMRTVSKLGLAGVRLGYMAGAAPWIEQFEKVRPPYNVNVLTEAAVRLVLKHKASLDAQAEQLRHDREALQEALSALPGVRPFASRANFILARVPDSARIFAAMRERGVLIKDVSKMHPMLANCLRITIGSPSENQAMLAALNSTLSASL